jgi:hypothetical protein
MRTLNKTERQRIEYNKLEGFRLIREKYTLCSKKINKNNHKFINTEFNNFCNKVRSKNKMPSISKNYYERMWIQEYNKLKKKINI